jgi:hypoxanthine phosphoribosyltransferase
MRIRVLFDEAAVQGRVSALAAEIAAAHRHEPPLVIGILNGAVPFMMDLLKALPAAWRDRQEFDFYDATSYDGRVSSGDVVLSRTPVVELAGRAILVVDGIVDTGQTLKAVLDHVASCCPAQVQVCTLLDKPSCRRADVPVDYRGFEVADVFVVGYGMDWDQRYRALRYIGCLDDNAEGA